MSMILFVLHVDYFFVKSVFQEGCMAMPAERDCPNIQGFYYSKAVRKEEMQKILESSRTFL